MCIKLFMYLSNNICLDGKVQDGRASNESHHPENGTHKDAQPHDARKIMDI